jgi:hypothetical protein
MQFKYAMRDLSQETMALQKTNVKKRARRKSSDGFTVEEITTDDNGYDGDIEVLRPDQYEEPESDFEDDPAMKNFWPDTDEDLASKLRRLSCEPKSQHQQYDRGRKRLSSQMDEEGTQLDRHRHRHSDLEVLEIIDDQRPQRPPSKRRKGRTPLGQRVAKRQAQNIWSDSSDKTEEAVMDSPASPCTPERPLTPSRPAPAVKDGSDQDAMDLG